MKMFESMRMVSTSMNLDYGDFTNFLTL